MLKVALMHLPELQIVYTAGKTCVGAIDSEEFDLNFIKRLIERGHESVLEHAVYTFEIRNLGREVLQELVRHRMASYSVESTRWALAKIDINTSFINITEILGMDYIDDLQKGALFQVQTKASELLRAIKDAIGYGVPNDLLKPFLPEGITTNLIMTINLRSLRNFLKLRTAKEAYKPIRELAMAIYCTLPQHHRLLVQDCISNEK